MIYPGVLPLGHLVLQERHSPHRQISSPLSNCINKPSFFRWTVSAITLGSYSETWAAGQIAVQVPQLIHVFNPS